MEYTWMLWKWKVSWIRLLKKRLISNSSKNFQRSWNIFSFIQRCFHLTQTIFHSPKGIFFSIFVNRSWYSVKNLGIIDFYQQIELVKWQLLKYIKYYQLINYIFDNQFWSTCHILIKLLWILTLWLILLHIWFLFRVNREG